MGQGLSQEQINIVDFVAARDMQRDPTTIREIVQHTGRSVRSCWWSLQGLERRGLMFRAGKVNRTIIWTCSEELAQSFRHPVMTCIQGDNSDLMEQVERVYLSPGQIIADVTYGLGVFWRKIDTSKYRLLKSDVALSPTIGHCGVIVADFRFLPYKDGAFDVVVLDPPYMHGGATIKDSINQCYLNENGSGKDIIAMYREAVSEAQRVLRPDGMAMVKVGDEIESGQVQFNHITIHQQLEDSGFRVVQHFVLMRKSIPAMRVRYQLHARTNHSYLIVAKKRRPQSTLNKYPRRFYAKGH